MYAENLKKIRLALGLSVAKFAEKLEMSASTLTGYERRERTPSWLLFTQLYIKANVNLNWFVSGEGEMFNAGRFEDFKDEILKQVDDILVKYGVKNK
jgi:transcriptional regulator with XRE-family HTH domain